MIVVGVNPLDGVNVAVDNDDEDDDVDDEDRAGDGTIGFVSFCDSSSQESIGDVDVGAGAVDDVAEADCGEFDEVGGASPFVVFAEFGNCCIDDSLLMRSLLATTDCGGGVDIDSSALPIF